MTRRAVGARRGSSNFEARDSGCQGFLVDLGLWHVPAGYRGAGLCTANYRLTHRHDVHDSDVVLRMITLQSAEPADGACAAPSKA